MLWSSITCSNDFFVSSGKSLFMTILKTTGDTPDKSKEDEQAEAGGQPIDCASVTLLSSTWNLQRWQLVTTSVSELSPSLHVSPRIWNLIRRKRFALSSILRQQVHEWVRCMHAYLCTTLRLKNNSIHDWSMRAAMIAAWQHPWLKHDSKLAQSTAACMTETWKHSCLKHESIHERGMCIHGAADMCAHSPDETEVAIKWVAKLAQKARLPLTQISSSDIDTDIKKLEKFAAMTYHRCA